jgi:hypothetical protein
VSVEESSSGKLSMASDLCLAKVARSYFIGPLRKISAGKGDLSTALECWRRLRVQILKGCYTRTSWRSKQGNILLLEARDGKYTQRKIVLLASAMLPSDNRLTLQLLTNYLSLEKAITRLSLDARNIRQHSSGHTQQHQNPSPHSRSARFAASCESLMLRATLPSTSTYIPFKPEGRFQQPNSLQKKLEGMRIKGGLL